MVSIVYLPKTKLVKTGHNWFIFLLIFFAKFSRPFSPNRPDYVIAQSIYLIPDHVHFRMSAGGPCKLN